MQCDEAPLMAPALGLRPLLCPPAATFPLRTRRVVVNPWMTPEPVFFPRQFASDSAVSHEPAQPCVETKPFTGVGN